MNAAFDGRREGGGIRVLVVAGYTAVRAGLHAMLAGEPCLRILGDTTADSSLTPLLIDLRPDVLLVDSGGDGAEANNLAAVLTAVRGQAAGSRPAIVAIGDTFDRDLPHLADSDLPGWAYLLRGEANGPQLATAIRAASNGLVALDPALPLSRLWSDAKGAAPAPVRTDAGETLTVREMEVLALMAEGLPNKIIATRLGISLHTAKFHVAQILGKLDAASRTEAVTVGARRGFLTL